MGSLKIKEKNIKTSKEDLISTPELVRDWVESNAKWIAGALAAIAIVLLVVWGIRSYQNARETNARQAYFQITNKWPGGGGNPANPAAPAAATTDPTAGNWEEYIPAAEEFVGKYGSTKAGLSARVDLVQAYVRSGRYQDAVTQGQKLLGDIPAGDPLVPPAGYQVALAYEQLGNPDEALAVWNRVKSDGYSVLGRELHWRAGLSYAKRRDFAKAAEQFDLAMKAAGSYPPDTLIETELAAARAKTAAAGAGAGAGATGAGAAPGTTAATPETSAAAPETAGAAPGTAGAPAGTTGAVGAGGNVNPGTAGPAPSGANAGNAPNTGNTGPAAGTAGPASGNTSPAAGR